MVFATAMAERVSEGIEVRVIGPLYTVEAVVGVEPSVV
jgi:hypothetical protein